MSELEKAGMFGILIGTFFSGVPFAGILLLSSNPYLAGTGGMLCASLVAQVYLKRLRKLVPAGPAATEAEPRDRLKTNIDEFYIRERLNPDDRPDESED